MADDVLWEAEPHTLAKHAVLTDYLQAWLPILTRQSARLDRGSREILFIDGFAGPGEYRGGEPGSPILAVRAALEHSVDFPVPIRFLFIEEREDRCYHLQQVLRRYDDELRQSKSYRVTPPVPGLCEDILGGLLDTHEKSGTRFGPALAFLDQFGYSGVPMNLVKRILAYPQCEVFLYLDYKDMNRFIGDPTKAPGFTRTYGGDEWRTGIRMAERERRRHLLDAYKRALQERAKCKYVCAFTMFDQVGRLLYWLIFCTNNLRGLEEMKKAMWKVDDTGAFRFSDEDDPAQLKLLQLQFDQEWLANNLRVRLANQTLTIGDINEFVLTQTPCYRFKEALKILETSSEPSLEIVRAPANRRRGSYPDESITIRFRPNLPI